MAAFSDYLKVSVLDHLFRDTAMAQPTNISVALVTSATLDADTGATFNEVPLLIDSEATGYARVSMGSPSDDDWTFSGETIGTLLNTNQVAFNAALVDWGAISGVAILDSNTHGAGNILMHATLENARLIYMGDKVRFDSESLEISV
jgi:hypothetical protein